MASGMCVHIPPNSQSCAVSCWHIHRVRISLECLSLKPMVDLLFTIRDCTDDLMGSTANQVIRIWPVYFEQFGKFQTTMG